MGRSATFVNTMLIGNRPNRANTTCSHENMWREEENKKSILHTSPNDKSGAKRGEKTSYWTVRENGTKQDQSENKSQWRNKERAKVFVCGVSEDGFKAWNKDLY